MVEEGRWGIIYCPKGGLLGNPVKRWEQAERCLQAHNIQYD
ncbi:MAG: lipid kinase, partial [Prevotella pallens]|nr:lipid kinase [Prevotella pallens]